MIGVLREVAKRVAELELRLEKFTWAEVTRQSTATDNASEERTQHLRHMAKVAPGSCLKLLGAHIQLDGGHNDKF